MKTSILGDWCFNNKLDYFESILTFDAFSKPLVFCDTSIFTAIPNISLKDTKYTQKNVHGCSSKSLVSGVEHMVINIYVFNPLAMQLPSEPEFPRQFL